MIAGFEWLTFFYPPLGYRVFLVAAVVGLLGATANVFWLLVFGVDEGKFRAIEAANE